MILTSIDHIKAEIKEIQYKNCWMWDGHLTDTSDISLFGRHLDTNAGSLNKRIDTYGKQFPGHKFTIELAINKNDPGSSRIRRYIQFDEIEVEAGKPGTAVAVVTEAHAAPAVNQAEMEATITERVTAMMEERSAKVQAEMELKLLKDQLKGYETGADKLGFAMSEAFKHAFPDAVEKPAQATLQGVESDGETVQEGEVEYDLDELEQAFTIILDKLGVETVFDLANKLNPMDKDDASIQMYKQMLSK